MRRHKLLLQLGWQKGKTGIYLHMDIIIQQCIQVIMFVAVFHHLPHLEMYSNPSISVIPPKSVLAMWWLSGYYICLAVLRLQNMNVRLTQDSKLSVGMNLNGCLYVACDCLATSPGCTMPLKVSSMFK